MWVLDVVADEGNGADTTFYLVAGEWSVGRKRCHFNFQADASISRTHALIRVGALTDKQLGDPATRPTLELVDQNSRFGSFVNQEQCLETRRLQHGDQISFGAKRTVLRVRYQVFVLVASRIQRRIVATVKVLWALVYNQPVSMQELIEAMGGVVVAAYENNEQDVQLLLFTSVQELAASVIFVKPPTTSNDEAFSNSLASYAGSSVQILSFPEHLSLWSTSTSAEANEGKAVGPDHEDMANDSVELEVNPADITLKENSEQMTDPYDEDVQVKGEARDDANINIAQIPIKTDPEFKRQVPMASNIRNLEATLAQPEMTESDCKPLVVSCDLIVKKRATSSQSSKGENGLANYKRFKKGNVIGTRRSTASLFPQQTVISVTVDNPEREVLQENLEAMEEEERIAEELFAMGEGRAASKLFG
ncbi:hypothetical protein BBO99_00002609 [Phytophthora kernoviae]|uniref:FHA domain-containing protein n=1 Tax=Phytophthora kernoviae TaxID=325452 RepID=A0A3R7H5K6_9STRA|nr:hypothetical protein BBI17_002550 [Phytophthora kernoviae]RLN82818.1 hypothetical protein BBO99_00002609 [Phytophthora kernoviae]